MAHCSQNIAVAPLSLGFVYWLDLPIPNRSYRSACGEAMLLPVTFIIQQ
jgi:hypothetical protein